MGSNEPLFGYFDVIRIVDVDGQYAEIDRHFGVVLGMSQADDGTWHYAVSVYNDIECTDRIDGWQISEFALASTGRRVTDADMFTGEIVKANIGHQ